MQVVYKKNTIAITI